MGMDIYGKSGHYFRANIWSWRAIRHALELAGFDVPAGWGANNGEGLESTEDCLDLADTLQDFLTRWDGDVLTMPCERASGDPSLRRSPYQTDRAHLLAFVAFLRECDGFEIH